MTKEELSIFVNAGRNIFYFASFAKIIHPILGKVPFILYPFQKRVLWEFINHRFNIILKARQMGLTELIGLYVLWVALFGINKNIVIISLKDRVAKRFLRRIKHIYMNLPSVLQVPIINGRKGEFGTSDEMMFANGSIITSIPTTEDAGRSEAVTILVMDEVAIMKYADIIWAAAAGTLFTGGSAILNSCITGDTEIIGRDGLFRIDSICPKEFGKKDISKLNIQVLSHTGKWQRVLGAVNKGLLETWEIANDRGDTLKCTPAHKLLTSKGWLPVKEIIEKGYNAIFYDAGLEELENTRTTILPEKEIIKDIDGYPNVHISKLTLKKKYLDTIYDISVEEDESYITSSKYVSHNTPYGTGNFYHKQWVDALVNKGPNTFNPIQIPWYLHPDRDLEWYKANKQLLGPRRAAQEIDCDFLTSGDTVFDLVDIKAIQDGLLDYPPIKTELEDRLLIFKDPNPNEEYFIGIDVSTGRSRDYSAFSVMNRAGFEFAAFKGRIPLNKLKIVVSDIGKRYNYAKIGPESNDIGEALTSGLQEMGYPNLYYTQKLLTKRGENQPQVVQVPGWYTTSKNRPIIIDNLERCIREDTVTINDPFFISEAYTFIYDESNRPVAMNKGEYIGDGSNTYSDDAILAKCITNWIRQGKVNSINVSPY